MIEYQTFFIPYKTKTNMEKGVGVILKKNGKILLQLRNDKKSIASPNCWGPFGGCVNKGETFEQAAIREIKEELGITLDKNKLEPAQQTKTNTYFRYPLKHKISELKLNEGQDMKLFTKQEVLKLKNTTPGLKEGIIENWKDA